MKSGTYDTMQVCKNGHRINDSCQRSPEHTKAFCPKCGEPTITECPACKAPIKGQYYLPNGGRRVERLTTPSFCEGCGMPFPWQVSKVANAIAVLRLQGVPETDVLEIEQNLPDITRDTPGTQSATLRVKKILGRVSKPLYGIGIKVIGDIAASAAKAQLGL